MLCQPATRTESIYLGATRMLRQLVGLGPVERLMTRTDGVSARVTRMLSQPVGFGPVERAIIKSIIFFLEF